MTENRAISKAKLQIFADHCAAAAESMAYTLHRTAHSSFVKETEDFTTGLATPEGLTFASPRDLGATWFVCLDYGNVIRQVENYEEGDIWITSDPYSGYVATHTPDIHLWKPIFQEGEIIAFAVSHIHNTDVGGAVPASLSRTLTEVHQEGIRIPVCRLVSNGKLNEDLLKFMRSNVRVPEQNWGDLKAQIAALQTGERKVRDMVVKFGLDVFKEGLVGILDYAEEQARQIVAGMSDGSYEFSDYIDEDSDGGRPCRIALKVTISGSSLKLDFTGSDPQLQSSLNLPTGGNPRHALIMVGLTYVLYAVNPQILLNSGLARVVTGTLPEGTCVNPVFPAAVGMRSMMCKRVQGLIMGTFAQVLPDLMPADPSSGGPMVNVNAVDFRTGKRVVACINPMPGGGGGSARCDGTDGSGGNEGYLKNTPIEISEIEAPVRISRYELAPDTAGPGQHRGGMGTILQFSVVSPGTRVTARNRDRSRFNAWGLRGGREGQASTFLLNPSRANERNLGNTDIIALVPGDVIRITSGGGGGFGDPMKRVPSAVLRDVVQGRVSIEAARDIYGVVIQGNEIDEKLTAERRGTTNGVNSFYTLGQGRREFEAVWNEHNYRKLTEVLSGLPYDWRFFVKHSLFDFIGQKPADTLRLDGSDVEEAFIQLCAQMPALTRAVSAVASQH
ncbi:hydantoinase B/oxoprolinase family protein [Mesorhizobium sp.]|uniref:hydantoinase B/oxoprolinase family protein n=1 Tax=Mesorhizobium sp. TaxID=1871066 RepID=UPI000FE81663|nr:hydantoinase B/oxoprolinase family protein [Mesorhizobium sp.]RWJ05732.1 MAG: hydantoinase B/oxoprolinase family protein [Mesorhizobium sp.]